MIIIKFKKSLVIVICILIIFSLGVSANEGITVTVKGMANIEKGDMIRAREIAIDDALRKAVEKAVGTMVSAQTKVENYKVIEDSILTKSKGYVTNYEVLDKTVSYNTYKVKVKADVVKKVLKNDLETLDLIIKRANNPRVMVVIPEQHIERSVPDPAAETEIIRQLTEKDFRVVDQKQVEKARNTEALRRALNGDKDACKQLASKFKADILVIGEAFSEFVGEYSGLESCRARVEARVVRADTGNILTAHGLHASGADITELTASKKALRKAGEKMADYLIKKIPEELSANERSVQLTISDIDFTNLKKLESKLKSTHLIENVYIRDFSGSMAQMEIKTSILPMQLADKISKWNKLSLKVIGLSGSKIELKKEE